MQVIAMRPFPSTTAFNLSVVNLVVIGLSKGKERHPFEILILLDFDTLFCDEYEIRDSREIVLINFKELAEV